MLPQAVSNAAEVGAAMIFFTTAMASALVVAQALRAHSSWRLRAPPVSEIFRPPVKRALEKSGLRGGCSLRVPRAITCGSLAHQSQKRQRGPLLVSTRH